MLRLLKTISLFLLPVILTAQHPITFFTKAEAAEIKRDITKYPLLTRSYNEIKNEVMHGSGKMLMFLFLKILPVVIHMISIKQTIC